MTEMKPQTQKLKGMRRTIAKRMHESISGTAQLTLHATMEIPELVAFKKEQNVSYTDLFVKAAALALKKHPNINASLMEREIQLWPNINVGLAVSLDEGLIVPCIFDADQKSLEELKESRKDILTRVPGELTAEEVNSGTFTISNLGTYPVDGFTPILNPPQVALLGIGRIQELPRVADGEITVLPVIHLSLTIDHQVVDGAPGAAFLQEIEGIFKQPEQLR